MRRALILFVLALLAPALARGAAAPITLIGAGSVLSYGYTAAQIIVDVDAPGDAVLLTVNEPYHIDVGSSGGDLISCSNTSATRCALTAAVHPIRLQVLALADETCDPAIFTLSLESDATTFYRITTPAPCVQPEYRVRLPVVAQ